MEKKEEESKKSYISDAFEGILVDRTRSADPEENEDEKNENEEDEEQKVFASVDEALQFLSTLTNSKIVIID